MAFLLLAGFARLVKPPSYLHQYKGLAAEAYAWWQLPMKSLVFLGIMCGSVLLGITVSFLLKTGTTLFTSIISFVSITLFYKLSQRKPLRILEILIVSLFISFLIQIQNYIFMIYIDNIAKFNIVYGTLGAIMALLLWIYFSGCIFIFGACLCSAQTEDNVNS